MIRSRGLLSPILSASQLASRLGASNLVVLDSSLHLDPSRDPRAEWEAERIPGSHFFDINAVSDADSDLPHMLPSTQTMAAALAQFGADDSSHFVIYDTPGLFSAARTWWTLRYFGIDGERVQVLDGGLPAWKQAGFDVDSGPTGDTAKPSDKPITLQPQEQLVWAYDDVVRASEAGSLPIVDARGAARFRGEAPEPREGLSSGHMPHSMNVPFNSLLREDDCNRLRSPDELKAVFEAAGLQLPLADTGVLASCGSGVTACVVLLALARLEQPFGRAALYDGSWSDYASHDGSKIVMGE
eukprot:PLAT12981.2.p1 GENE.PLAT12981.2~~PLAT12981.2.p1  ORF type:complete len:309 (+),score=111.90 PLAT12981.2:32-928(+)